MKKALVLFDFDGTLSKKDTYIQFLFFFLGTFRALTGLVILSPYILLFYLRLISSHGLKLKMTDYFFKNQEENKLISSGKEFVEYLHLTDNLRDGLMTELKNYKAKGHEVCIVSASLDIWLKPFAERYGINYLCTEVKYVNGRYGGFSGLNCNRREKAVRIKNEYRLEDFAEIIAYGNSSGDKYMFDLATRTVYIR
jgi:phosphatidylglycerophosphatase C